MMQVFVVETMKRSDTKSHCPVNFALETFGDTWSLLIIRDIVFWGKKTYGEYLKSKEGISTSILSARLEHLVQKGILTKTPYAADKRKDTYTLTEKGLDVIPQLLEMAGWSSRYDPKTTAPKAFVAAVYADREKMFKQVKQIVRDGGSIFGQKNHP